MKRVKSLVLFLAFTLVAVSAYAKGEQYLVAGSGWDKIAIIDKESKSITWAYPVPSGGECNSVVFTKGGTIAFAYSTGARAVDITGRTLWDYKADSGYEIQSIVQMGSNFALGICGTPAKIVVLDRFGKEVSTTSFDTGIKNAHSQFRQIRVTPNKTFLVPMLSGELREYAVDGTMLNSWKPGGGLFSVTQLKNGNYLLPQGDSHSFIEFDPKTSTVVNKYDSEWTEGVKLGFVGQLIRYDDGRTILANWLLHGGDKSQPKLMELSSDGKVLWFIDKNDKEIGAISAVEPVKKGKLSK